MDRITKEQYEFALNRIEDLLPLVTDDTPANDKNAIELTLMSDIVEKRNIFLSESLLFLNLSNFL